MIAQSVAVHYVGNDAPRIVSRPGMLGPERGQRLVKLIAGGFAPVEEEEQLLVDLEVVSDAALGHLPGDNLWRWKKRLEERALLIFTPQLSVEIELVVQQLPDLVEGFGVDLVSEQRAQLLHRGSAGFLGQLYVHRLHRIHMGTCHELRVPQVGQLE